MSKILVADNDFTKKMEKALQKAHDELETRVEERTAALSKANEDLRIEIARRIEVEKELRTSEEKYRTFLETTSEGYVVINGENELVDFNSTFCKMIGYRRDELLGKTPSDFVDDENKRILVEQLSKIPTTDHRSYDVVLQKKNGDDLPVHINSTTIRNKSGKVESSFSLFTDITDRKKSEKKFRLIADNSMDVIWTVNLDLVFTYVSPSVENLYGYTIDDVANMEVREVFTPESFQEIMETFVDGFLGAENVEDISPVVLEVQSIKKDSTVFWTEVSAGPMVENGKLVGVQGATKDISLRKEAEIALLESEGKFRLISEQSLLGIGIVQDGRIDYANEIYSKMTGYSLEEIYGWEPYGYARTVYKGDRPFVMEQSRKKQVGEKDVITNYRLRGVTKAKRILWWDLYSRTITYHGKPAVLFMIVDVDERVKAENDRKKLQSRLQRAEKMEAVGTLAGGVAHDLNNILSGLVSYPELLLMQLPENNPLRKPIMTIQKSGEKASAVVQDLLTLARRGVVATEVVNLNDVIVEYLESPEYKNLQSYHPGVHLETRLEKDSLNILGSSTHLSKTVMNLVSNSAEAMFEGGSITVSTESRYIDGPIRNEDDVKEGEYVILTVSDNGRGIAPDDIERIFEPFYTKKKMGRSGTGLGMAVVWGTVKDHNGYIDVQSSEGRGTVFTLYFPVTREKMPGDEDPLSVEAYRGNGESILIVDDLKEQREIASGMLKELGYSVESVSSGEEAVEYLKTHEMNLLILDMIMDPGMDGLDTYQKIVELHPGQKAIIASGFSETDRVKEVQSLGAAAYIRKPFLLEKIGVAVKRELEK